MRTIFLIKNLNELLKIKVLITTIKEQISAFLILVDTDIKTNSINPQFIYKNTIFLNRNLYNSSLRLRQKNN